MLAQTVRYPEQYQCVPGCCEDPRRKSKVVVKPEAVAVEEARDYTESETYRCEYVGDE